MPQERRPHSFAHKIELFWRQRIELIAPAHVAAALLSYAQNLIAAGHAPSLKGRSYDWPEVAVASGLGVMSCLA